MLYRRLSAVLLVWASHTGATTAQHTGTAPAAVVITGSQSDTQTRRDFVAGKILISRKRIEESGARTVEELLKREPAVTVGSDGRIGLLNLPGYTQLLVDGQPPAAGQQLERLDLIHVDKVEIIKSSVAEFGPFGIAGTINVVTRATGRKTNTQSSVGLKSMHGRIGKTASLSHNQSTAGSPLRFSAQLSAGQNTTPGASRTRLTVSEPGSGEQTRSHSVARSLARHNDVTANVSVTWQRGPDDTITLSPDVYTSRSPVSQAESTRWRDSATLDLRQETRSSLEMMALPLKWTFKPDRHSRVDINLRTHRARFDSTQRSISSGSLEPAARREVLQRRRGHTHRLEMLYRTRLDGDHDVKMGATLLRGSSEIDYAYRIDDQPDNALAALGTTWQSNNRQLRLHLQDEWRLNDSLALNAGVASSQSALDLDEAGYRNSKRFALWSPSLHLAKKINGDDKRQLRFSIARSFKAPSEEDFMLRPEINARAPCFAGALCGPNSIDTADKSGNPQLRPESATGLNIAYEYGIGADSQITIDLFRRRIGDKIGTEITLDSVPWSTSPRYVRRPANLGHARSTGLSIDMDLALRDVLAQAPKASVRGSVALARSRIDDLPGPDNRLDQQTPWTAKLGGSYSMQTLPLKFDIDASWSPSVWIRASLAERLAVARRFDLDASVQWALYKDARLVTAIRAAYPRDAQRISDYVEDAMQSRQYVQARRYAELSVRFETKL